MGLIIYDENRVWVRITNYCNSNCIFCLDGEIKHRWWKIEKDIILKKIKNEYKKWFKNKLILSWWEASSNEYFLDYIKYGKQIWYEKIQTITNWIKWWDADFCKQAIDSWLNEITFSLHGHNISTHDGLTKIKWSFKNIITWIVFIKNNYPNVILNSDIVVNKKNIQEGYKIIQLLKKLWIWEYDILQIIPFWRAWDFKNDLMLDNIKEAKLWFQKIWEEWEDDRVHMRANRVFPEFLEWYEKYIQNPEKIEDEVYNENGKKNEIFFNQRKNFFCKEKNRCNFCYLKNFCQELENFYEYEYKKYSIPEFKDFFKLETNKTISKINEIYPAEKKDFLKQIKKQAKGKDIVVNIPYCIFNRNNYYTKFIDAGLKKTYKNFIEWFMNEGFTIKSPQCKFCALNEKCKWIHINIIKKYWFKILKPIK